MIGGKVTVEYEKSGSNTGQIKGAPMDGAGNKLTQSNYQPSDEVLELFSRCMHDYQIAYNLQHRPFDYFDGQSLLERTRNDQRTFGAFVGAEWVPQQNKWRWKGRKNTARNKLIGVLAHVIAGILFPTVFAQDDQQKDQKTAAKVMRIQVEHHLRKAKYDIQFLFAALSALVCPAVFVQVEWIESMQRVKVLLESGEASVQEAVDDLISGLNLSIRPIDEIMLGDFYTFEMQRQPYIVDVQRISYDLARSRYAKRFYNSDKKDLFDFVEAGKTRVVIAGQEKQVLYDIEWTEADRNFVQVLTFKYRPEDLEVVWVGGVFMGNEGTKPGEIYNLNPFKHRRMALIYDENGSPQWGSMPVYNIGKTGFEPLDPNGRFAYYKSGSFKEFWEDASINHAYQLLQDGMTLDVMKPVMISGIAKVDGQVMAPGAVAALPEGAKINAYSLGPNLAAAMNVLQENKDDISESTIAPILQGQLDAKQTAFAVNASMANAKLMLGVFGLLIADLVMQIGDLTVDCIVQHCTIGQLDTSVAGALGMRYKTYLAQSKEHGRDITHKIVYTDSFYTKSMSQSQIRQREYELWEEAGGSDKSGHIWEVNPYATSRMLYQTFIDADQMIARSIGGDKQMKRVAFEMLTDPRVAPFIDAEAVVTDFVIEEYGGNDPERYKKKGGATPEDSNAMMEAIMQNTKGAAPQNPGNGGMITPTRPGNGKKPGKPGTPKTGRVEPALETSMSM